MQPRNGEVECRPSIEPDCLVAFEDPVCLSLFEVLSFFGSEPNLENLTEVGMG